jgi:hypothetical protein
VERAGGSEHATVPNIASKKDSARGNCRARRTLEIPTARERARRGEFSAPEGSYAESGENAATRGTLVVGMIHERGVKANEAAAAP